MDNNEFDEIYTNSNKNDDSYVADEIAENKVVENEVVENTQEQAQVQAEPIPVPKPVCMPQQAYVAQNTMQQPVYVPQPTYVPQNYNYQNPNIAPPKPKAKKGVKIFVRILIFIAAVAVTTTCISLIKSIVPVSSDEFNKFFEDFENDYGDFFDPDEPSIDIPMPDIDMGDKDKFNTTIPDIDIPSVTEGITLNAIPSTAELSPADVYKKVFPSTVSILTTIDYSGTISQGTGTGVFLTEDGFILTNSHVIGDTKKCGVTVTTTTGDEYPAIVVGYDKANDLAVIKIDGTGFTPAEFGNSDDLIIGQWVLALGNPGGFEGSFTRGIVSGLDRSLTVESDSTMKYIQTDAAINPGNSGGPLLNMYGQVVGINTSKIVAEYYEGIGFAIPTTYVKSIVDELLEYGYVSGRVRLGITAMNVTEEDAEYYSVPMGVQIVSINDDSCFVGTTVKENDIIVAIDGEEVVSLEYMSQLLLSYSQGQEVELEMCRVNSDGGTTNFKVKVILMADNGETQQ